MVRIEEKSIWRRKSDAQFVVVMEVSESEGDYVEVTYRDYENRDPLQEDPWVTGFEFGRDFEPAPDNCELPSDFVLALLADDDIVPFAKLSPRP